MKTIGRDLNEMQHVPSAGSHVAALRAAGTVAHYAAGAFLVQPGDPVDRFRLRRRRRDRSREPLYRRTSHSVHPRPQPVHGEISLLHGGAWSMPMRAVRDTRVVEVPRSAMLGLMSEIPEMSDIIITVVAARRRRRLDLGHGTLVLLWMSRFADASALRFAEMFQCAVARSLWPRQAIAAIHPDGSKYCSNFSELDRASRGTVIG